MRIPEDKPDKLPSSLKERHATRIRIMEDELRRMEDECLVGINSFATSRSGGRQNRTLTSSARRRISLAQKARWAKVRGRNVVSIASKRGKGTISAAGRKRIAAAQRARWAKVRAAKKAA